ncbi:sensor histidine kinase [Paragemmobacter aquarius]|nr:HWE histidine kinase domain-containing protein [Gemmobacter aquarius]
MTADAVLDDWPRSSGTMANLIRQFDWSASPIGEIPRWPGPLRTAIDVMLSSGFLASVAWGPDLIVFYNDEMAGILDDHHPRLFGQPLLASLPPDRSAVYVDHLARVRRGETVVIDTMHYPRQSNGQSSDAWLSARYLPLRDESGDVAGMMILASDITARKRQEERLAGLYGELQHRTRNLMGVVRSMFEKSLETAPDLPAFAETFRSRLMALARVQGLLAQLDEGDRITFDALLRAELSSLEASASDGPGPRVTLRGPSGIRLRSATVQTFALALHELASNAARHGALSQAAGRLAVDWRLDHRPEGAFLVVDWQETGVSVPPPATAGYGRELIERALPYQLDATSRLTFTPEGITCRIELPLREPVRR